MKFIKLRNCLNETMVDDKDYNKLSSYKWYWSDPGYARRTEVVDGQKKIIYLHREVIGISEGQITDHINRNTLDNRRANLRITNHSGNGMNRKISTNNKFGYLGISWNKAMKKWRAQVQVMRKCIHIGFFDDPKEANDAYRARKKKFIQKGVC